MYVQNQAMQREPRATGPTGPTGSEEPDTRPVDPIDEGDGERPITPLAPTGPAAWERWLASPAGRYVLRWEREQLDGLVSDVFGYYAVQLGLPELDALSANRMPHRLRAAARPLFLDGAGAATGDATGDATGFEPPRAIDLRIGDYDELPFDAQSVDLVVAAHPLEFSERPHQVLREIDRVLRPEGRLIVLGLNPLSLWGLRQFVARGPLKPFMPIDEQLIGVPRLRDWMKLLSFEIDRICYGCYAPPYRTQKWLDRSRFVEGAGDRWWPICGAVYIVSAVKRVRAMRLVGPVWRRRATAKTEPAVAVSGRTIASRRIALRSEAERSRGSNVLGLRSIRSAPIASGLGAGLGTGIGNSLGSGLGRGLDIGLGTDLVEPVNGCIDDRGSAVVLPHRRRP